MSAVVCLLIAVVAGMAAAVTGAALEVPDVAWAACLSISAVGALVLITACLLDIRAERQQSE